MQGLQHGGTATGRRRGALQRQQGQLDAQWRTVDGQKGRYGYWLDSHAYCISRTLFSFFFSGTTCYVDDILCYKTTAWNHKFELFELLPWIAQRMFNTIIQYNMYADIDAFPRLDSTFGCRHVNRGTPQTYGNTSANFFHIVCFYTS